jgi:hypothetical protein
MGLRLVIEALGCPILRTLCPLGLLPPWSHQTQLSRTVSRLNVLLDAVHVFHNHKEYEANFKVTAEQPVINEKDWHKIMENIREVFGSVLGETGVPLAYSIRDVVQVPSGLDPADKYITVTEEMITRAPRGT